MRGIKLVIFDLDGTLFDAYDGAWMSLNYALAQCGFESVTREQVKRSIGRGERALIADFVPEEQIEKVQKIYQEYGAKRFLDAVKILPGALDFLGWLKDNQYKIAVATNRPSWSTSIILAKLQLESYFDLVLCADQVSRMKPDPEMLFKILDFFHLTADQTVFVGDMDVDIQTGRAAGVMTVAVLTGSSSLEELNRALPDKVIKNIGEMKELMVCFEGDLSK